MKKSLSRSYKISPEDSHLFREAVKSIPPKSIITKNIKNNTLINITLSDTICESASINPTDILFFNQSGLQHSVIKNLKSGKIKPVSELDLHGLTVNEAREEIGYFISRAKAQHYRCIRIIHGKGKILKNHVNSWLKQIPAVLAFSSTVPKDGGTGAVYVLLKK